MGLDGTGSGTQRGTGRLSAAVPRPARPPLTAQPGSERGTRARIARLILENGPVTAAGLSTRLNLTPAAVRRHLDNLLADGMIETRTARRPASRGRGRPAKLFAITDVGRSAFEHAYDDLATSALRFLAEVAGPGAVAEFARRQVADLERRYGPVVQGAAPARPGRGPGRGAVRGWLRGLGERRPRPGRRPGRTARAPAGRDSSASITARWRTWPPSSRSCARRRRKRSPVSSAPRCSGWPPSRTATGSAPRTSPHQRS